MTAPAPRDAATVVIARNAPRRANGEEAGIEVLLLQRAQGGDHNSGAWVFPGGVVDRGDRAGSEFAPGLADAQASVRLGLAGGGLAFYLAAIRECFEEAGILFAVNGQGAYASLEDEAGWPTAALRRDLQQGTRTLSDLCRQFGLQIVPERLQPIAHWLTPLGRAKRFDTWFFLAIAPGLQAARHDDTETLDHVWIAPADALSASNVRRLMVPTRAVLEMVRGFRTTDEIAQWAAATRNIGLIQPRLALSAAGLESIPPGHPAYAEIGKLDPEGRCDAWCEFREGLALRISEHVLRTTDARGQHTYRVGSDALGWEDVVPGSVRLVAGDRVVIAPDLAAVPAGLRQAADWVAGRAGFLQPVGDA